MSWLSDIVAGRRGKPERERREPALTGWGGPREAGGRNGMGLSAANESGPGLPPTPSAPANGASRPQQPPKPPDLRSARPAPPDDSARAAPSSARGARAPEPAPVSRETARPLPKVIPDFLVMAPGVSIPCPRADKIRLGRRTPETYARALLDFIRAHLEPGHRGMICVPEMPAIYAHVCARLGWPERPWNPIAGEFRFMTTGDAKPYGYLDDAGRPFVQGYSVGRHRRRVYYVDAAEMFGASNPPTMVLSLASMIGPAAAQTPRAAPPEAVQPETRRAA